MVNENARPTRSSTATSDRATKRTRTDAAAFVGPSAEPAMPGDTPTDSSPPVAAEPLSLPDPAPTIPAPSVASPALSGESTPASIDHTESTETRTSIHPQPPAALVPEKGTAEGSSSATPAPPGDIPLPVWVPHDLTLRIPNMLTFADPKNTRWSISRIPSHAKWGGNRDQWELARYLCAGDVPITIFIVGTLTSKRFTDKEGDPLPRVQMGIRPLVDEHRRDAASLLGRCRPPQVVTLEKVYAGRLMSQWGKNDQKASTLSFTNIFDARKGYGRKSAMKRLHPHEIGKGDLVLVELTLTRYRPASVYTWDHYKTAFELRAVSLLAECPAEFVADDSVDFDIDGDVSL
ncbi:hypothetical protein GY45DRAFT_1369312 [Cubamyces sp. BRFM 1775]|nr:hypothetical protein GY45DRAFT_1369312 [Cubamyces sp. BRFM 1775]